MRRPPTRTLAFAVALAAMIVAPSATRAAAAPDSLAEAQARITAAQVAADRAASEFDAAQTRYYALEQEIGRTQKTIAGLRAESDRLRIIVQQRAIVAYKGGGQQPLDGLLGDAADALDVGRRAVLLNQANARSNTAIAEYRATSDDLRTRERSLHKQIDAQAASLKELRSRQTELQHDLDAALREQQQLKAQLERQRRAQEFATLLSQARAAARAQAAPPPTQPTSPPPGGGNGNGGGGGGSGGGNPTGGSGWTCPVVGGASFTDTWGSPRPGGRGHKGVDMFAARGTPVVAVLSGSVFFQGDPAGGNAAYVQASDGNTYYYAHLNDYVGGARSVSAGEVIGHVGNTGDASDSPSHLHFEMRLGGPNGTKVDAYSILRSHC